MWTQQSRGRMAQIAKKTKRYPSDLTDEEWERMAPLMPKPARRGRPREADFREVINAVRYLVRSGCWLADAADPFRGMAEGLWLVPGIGAQVYPHQRTGLIRHPPRAPRRLLGG